MAMNGQQCLELNCSRTAKRATLEELLHGKSERSKLYHAVLKKLREKTAFVSGNYQRRPIPAAALTPTQSQGRRLQPYSRPTVKDPHLTPVPFSYSQPSMRYSHPYTSSAVAHRSANPCAAASRTMQPARSAPTAYSTPPPLIQERADATQGGPHQTSRAAVFTVPPPKDTATPMDTPTGGLVCTIVDGCADCAVISAPQRLADSPSITLMRTYPAVCGGGGGGGGRGVCICACVDH